MKNCIIVLGMHRSGTSAATGVLSLLGGDIGATVMEKNHMNPRGFFENQRLRLLNDRILETLGAAWDDPFALQAGWEQRDELALMREQARQALGEEFGPDRLKLIKDPRLCVMLSFWQPLFDEIHLDPGYVVVVRHPLEAADSLTAGYGFPREKGGLLWMRHMLAAEAFTRGRARVFVRFNDLLSRPQQFQERVASGLGIDFPRAWEKAEEEVRAFLDPGLKHHNQEEARPVTPAMAPVLAAYEILAGMAAQPHGQGAQEATSLDRIRKEFQDNLDLFYHPAVLMLSARSRAADEMEALLQAREACIREKDHAIDNLQAQDQEMTALLGERDACIREKDHALGSLQVQNQEMAALLQERDACILEKSRTIGQLQAENRACLDLSSRLAACAQAVCAALQGAMNELTHARRELSLIQASKAWRLAQTYRKWVYAKLLGR